MIIEHLKKVSSTQEYVQKYIKKRQDALVYADEQTAGMGTKGRSFISQKGGLYVSKLTFHQNLKVENGWSIMVDTAMAVVKTLLCYGVDAKIKWPNDIWVNNKKICGILTKNAFCGEFIDYTIVGIGVNINNDIAEEIKDIAISLKSVLGREVDIQSFLLSLTLNLSTPVEIGEYKKRNVVLGQKITITRGEQVFESVATDILPNGALLLENGQTLYAGEVGLKIKID